MHKLILSLNYPYPLKVHPETVVGADMTKENTLAPRRAAILRVLRDNGKSLHLREIVKRTGLEYNNARSALSEMTTLNLLVRVSRGVYDLPDRVSQLEDSEHSHPFQKILLNQQILKVLLNIVITNKALMEALLLGQQEIIRTIKHLSTGNETEEEVVRDLEQTFAERVEWHFDVAAQKVVEQYTRLPAEVLDVLVAPLARDHDGDHVPSTAAPKSRARVDQSHGESDHSHRQAHPSRTRTDGRTAGS